MSFDLLDWCETRLDGRERGDEFPATCPFCGEAGKFSINIPKRKFRCFRASCRAGHVAHVIAQVDGCSLREAFDKLGEQPRGAPLPQPPKRKAFDDAKRWNVELPEEFIPCYQAGRDPEWRVIGYLRERVKLDTLKTFGVGFCRSGPYYNRAVLPVSTPLGRAFLARDATDGYKLDNRRPKYKNAPGDWASAMLYGWEQYAGGDLVLVEGPFDVLRLHEHGIAAMALMGKELGPGQRSLLFTLPRGTVITLWIDPEESRFVSDAIAASLFSRFRIRIAAKSPTDPGDSTLAQAFAAIDNAKDWT